MSEINIFSELNFRYILGTLIVLVFAARPQFGTPCFHLVS